MESIKIKMEFKSRQLSSKQKEILVDFVYARPDMYKGKLTATYTNAVSKALWKEVTCILNAIPGGATKDWKQWRKAWTDIKKNVKSRISKERKYSQGTGGGPPLPPPEGAQKTTDEKICEIITPVAMMGNQDVPESEIIFEDIIIENCKLTEQTSEQRNKSNEIDDPMEIQDLDAIQDEITDYTENPVLDHNYTSVLPKTITLNTTGRAQKKGIKENVKKRYTKAARLTDSIRNNKKFLEISQKGIVSTDNYREKKLEIIKKHYETKANYYQKKIEAFKEKEKYYENIIKILSDISNAVNNIAAS